MMKQSTRKPIPSHEHAESHQPQIISNEKSNKKRKATTHNIPTSNEKRLKLDSHAKQAIQLKCPICPKSFKSTEALMQGLMPHLHFKHKACTVCLKCFHNEQERIKHNQKFHSKPIVNSPHE